MDLWLDGQPLGPESALELWRPAELACVPPSGATLQLWLAEVALLPFLRPGDPTWRWVVPPQTSVGVLALRVCATWPSGATEMQSVALWVRSSALDSAQYQALLADLDVLGPRLLLALRGALLPTAWLPATAPLTPAEDLATLLGADLDRFCLAAERLLQRPPDHLRPQVRRSDPGRMRDFSRLDRLPPEGLLEPQPQTSFDSLENRLLKQTLTRLAHRISQSLIYPGLPGAARHALEAAHTRIQHLRASPVLGMVGPRTQVSGPTTRMQRDPDLRRVWQMWRHLQQHPLVAWDAATLALPIQRLDLLYERWCALRVALALLELPVLQAVAQNLLQPTQDDWGVVLTEGGSLVQLEHGAYRLNLRYQPRYTPGGHDLGSLDRHTRIPDLALEITCAHAAPHVIILDAKYRRDPHGGLPEAALADAYSYLGSIGTPAGQRVVHAVALLYPGQGAAEIYPNGIALIPLRPDLIHDLSPWLAQSMGV
ncbi:nuclease domain-containing protein [Candidatus Oscillochloris fontis]|uniref:nuclease domain-containing protein n=1 Tax=Candidatus Oscillochloris fontis TaxID=2496868 RepID=UPI00101D8F9E|nr:nuclease domain-containing protein [Candidatus Oscillochloris fontis]